jgi:general L-amino acid transport system permease protein
MEMITPQSSTQVVRRLNAKFTQNPIVFLGSTCLLFITLYAIYLILDWGLFNAVFSNNEAQCAAARGNGACWGMIHEKFRLIVFGRYPFDQQWRAWIACLLMLLVFVWSASTKAWQPNRRLHLLIAWIFMGIAFFTLLSGRLLFIPLNPWLTQVPTELWGGLPLTLLLSVSSILLATPLGILLALGRRSRLGVVSGICTVFIEVVRGVPLISVLFMASFMIPLFFTQSSAPDVLARVLIGITLFSSAYTAEVVRGGLQSVSNAQYEAALSLGMGYWRTHFSIVLPQALTYVIPGLVNNFISIFKDTSLITIVSLYELTGSLGLALNGDPIWRPYKIEGYLFIALIYFVFCFGMSLLSRKLEWTLKIQTPSAQTN